MILRAQYGEPGRSMASWRFPALAKTFRRTVLILISGVLAQAATVVDTGPGVSSGPGDGWCLCYDQWLAAEFTLDRPTTITQVEGWIQGLNGVTIQIRATALDRPGQAVLHEIHYSGPYSDQYRWFGPGGLDWTLRPGTYWVVFGVQEPGTGGGMAKNSPRPLGREASSSGPGGLWSVSNDLNLGIRMFGEASPPTVSFENTQSWIQATNSMADLRIVADPGRTNPVVVSIRRLAGVDLPEETFPVTIQPNQNLVSIPVGPFSNSAVFVLESSQTKVAAPSRVSVIYPPPRIWLCCDSVDVSATGTFATFLHTDVRVRTNLIVRGHLLDPSNRLIEPVVFTMGDGAGPVIPISWTNRNLARGGRLVLTSVEGQDGAWVMTDRTAILKGPPLISVGLCCPGIAPNGEGVITAQIRSTEPLPSEARITGDLRDSGGNPLARLGWRIPQGGSEATITHTNRALVGGGQITLVDLVSEPRVILGGHTNALTAAVVLPYVPPTTVSFSAPAYEFSDNRGFGIIMAVLSRPLPYPVNVRVRWDDPPNTPVGIFSFPAGAVTAQLQLTLSDPAILHLETDNLLPGDHPTTRVTMPPAGIHIVAPVPSNVEKGQVATFRLVATRPGADRTLEFYTRDLTAVAGRDYIATNGTLSFVNREAFISIPVTTNATGGLALELILTNAQNALFAATNLTIAVLSTPRFAQAVYFADENGDARVQLHVDNPMPFAVPLTMFVGRHGFGTQFQFEFPAGRTNEELKLPLGDAARHVHELTLTTGVPGQSVQSALVLPFGSATNTSQIVVQAGPVAPGNHALITFERRGNLNKPMLFSWATEDGTARAGIDYVASQNAVFFNRGERTAAIDIPTLQPDASERRSFYVVISEVSDPDAYFSDAKTEVPIIPEGGSSVWLFDSERFTVENAEAAAMYFYDRFGNARDYEYFTSDGSARAGFDYVHTKGILTNVVDGSIRVPLIDDTVVEPVKYFNFHVVQTAPTRTTNSITVYIGDNELASVRDPSFQLEAAGESYEYWAVLPDDRIVNLRRQREVPDVRIFSKDGALIASRELELLKDVNWSVASVGLDGNVSFVPVNSENKLSGVTPIYRISTETLKEEKIEIEGGFYRVLAAGTMGDGSMMVARARLLDDRWELVRLQPNGALDPTYPVFSASYPNGGWINRFQMKANGAVQIGFQSCHGPWVDCFDTPEILIHEGKLIRAMERAIHPERNRWPLPDGGSLVQLHNTFTGGSELVRKKADGTLDPDFASTFLDGENKAYVGTQADGSILAWSVFPGEEGYRLIRLKSSPALQENVLISGVTYKYPSSMLEGQTNQLTVFRAGNSALSVPFRINVANSRGEPAARFAGLDRIFQIPAGQSSLAVSFTTIDDRLGRPPETFILAPEPLAAGVSAGGAEMLIQVLDNDPGVALTVSGSPLTITFNQFAAGTTYDIEVSDDLVTWSPLGTRTGSSQWQETPDRGSRFFRARLK